MNIYDQDPDVRTADRLAALLICIFLLLLLLTSCSGTRTVVKTVTDYRDRWHVDSILVEKHDSIYVSVATKNDTVFNTVEKWRVEYRDRIHRDTVSVRVEVPVEVEKPVYVEKKLNLFQKAFILIGELAVLFLLLYLFYLYLKHNLYKY